MKPEKNRALWHQVPCDWRKGNVEYDPKKTETDCESLKTWSLSSEQQDCKCKFIAYGCKGFHSAEVLKHFLPYSDCSIVVQNLLS